MTKKALLVLLFAFFVPIWSKAFSPPTAPPSEFYSATFQKIIDGQALDGDLFARAIIASHLYERLSPEHYPFTLLYVDSNKVIRRYLAHHGLTEKGFLTHPKLRGFIERHLIAGFINTIETRTVRNAQETRSSADGSKVVLTTGINPPFKGGRLRFANGISFGPDCLFSGNNFSGLAFYKREGQLCVVTAPIAKNFDWSR